VLVLGEFAQSTGQNIFESTAHRGEPHRCRGALSEIQEGMRGLVGLAMLVAQVESARNASAA
jgi:hypothetical protein